eukprot:jgi/Astpho2/7431/e_gw1.00114.103.1_t
MTASTNTAVKDPGVPCPWAHLLLAGFALLPLVAPVPVNLNIVVTASLAVYVGCLRSIKPTPPEESMTRQDAMKFPLIGSAVLFGLFVVFKILPKDMVNLVLTGYFVLLGTFAVTATLLPFVAALCSKQLREKEWTLPPIRIPMLMKLTLPETIGLLPGVVLCVWYCLKKHWVANNALGLCFSIQGVEHLSLGAVSTGVILLAGLFFYDIFWVFCTPVMVSVAKSFDAPIKLLFPRAITDPEASRPFSMLGLGDIVIPGIFVALLLRYDVLHHRKYFRSCYIGYVGGLATTIVVMNVFSAAQPALLYIVPAVLGTSLGHAAINKEFNQVLHYSESKEDQEKAGNMVKGQQAQPSTESSASKLKENAQLKKAR